MPIYQYECCLTGEIGEVIFPISEANKKYITCPTHKNSVDRHVAEKIWSLPTYPSHGKPTVIYRNPLTGDTRVAILENQQTPDGYEKIELKTPMARSAAEKQMQERNSAEDEYVTERNRYLKEATQKNRHDDLKARMGTLTKDSDNPSAAIDLLKAGMNRNRKKKLPPKKTEFHFAVNHENKSNLDKG